MKKIYIGVMLSVLFSNCLILNPLGIQHGRESGSDAKDRIYTAALNGELLLTARFSGQASVNIRGLFYASIANDLANVQGTKYYMKSSVDDCVASIEEAGVLLLAAPLDTLTDALEYKRVFAPSLVCDLEEDGVIIGKPFPKI
ncbi:MAG: TIGR04452 family lipoprotein [Leptospira sp.]|nr:TIGR04452 family lipoprotein [Leptospira sp.]